MFTTRAVRALAAKAAGPCVSIIMPVYKGDQDRQNGVRLRNLMKDAAARLEALGAEPDAVLGELQQAAGEADFWTGQQDGLAIYCAEGIFERYYLPVEAEELIVVGDQFHVTPMLQALSRNARFYLFAVSQNGLRLFHCTRYEVHPVKLPETVPATFAEGMKFEDPDRQVIAEDAERGSNTVHHAHGMPDDRGKVKIREWLKQVDRGLMAEVLRDEQAPMLLACVEYMAPLYRDANTYPHLIEDVWLGGNPEGFRGEELRDKAWPMVEPYLFKAQRQNLERFGEMSGNGLASKAIDDIVKAAYGGRVGALFVAQGLHVWGTVDLEKYQVKRNDEPRPGDQDLLAVAAAQTLLHGGDVYTLDREQLPDQSPAAAVYRY